jgi:hypothetical protein
MISRRDASGKELPDSLDRLIAWTLYDYAGQVSPPDRVWERVKRTAEFRAATETWLLKLVRVGRAVGEWLWRPAAGGRTWYVGREALYKPMMFSVWDDRLPLSVICIIGQHSPVLRLGWVT